MHLGYRKQVRCSGRRPLRLPSLRNRADAWFTLRIAKIDENPLRRCARCALIGRGISGNRLRKREMPAPAQTYLRFRAGLGDPCRLHAIQQKVAASGNNYDCDTRDEMH
jgi:hypothetical protein